MSERMTGICLRGVDGRWAEWGRKTVPEMVAIYRERARRQKAAAEAILSAADEDFYVDTYLGPQVHRDATVLQEGKPRL